MQIERRHMEIGEILRKLLELDAANKAEADSLLRISEEMHTLPRATEGGSRRRPGDDCWPAADATMSSGDDETEADRPGVKRRNPFSRAVSAIRRKFSRSQPHERIPAAA